MGTTIRRQPITNSIPASPDYKFLNITNFGGIEKSSNPFVVSSNTASDCLNVYVDEDNALTTRPRLEQKADLIKLVSDAYTALNIDGSFDIIAVYDLHDGYLLHGVQDNHYYMFKIEEKNSTLIPHKILGNNIPSEKCVVFEQDEKIYLFCSEDYYTINNYSLIKTEPYVPVVKTGVSDDFEGHDYESVNILSDKIKETRQWKGFGETINIPGALDIDNEYYESVYTKINDLPDAEIIGVFSNDWEGNSTNPRIIIKSGVDYYYITIIDGELGTLNPYPKIPDDIEILSFYSVDTFVTMAKNTWMPEVYGEEPVLSLGVLNDTGWDIWSNNDGVRPTDVKRFKAIGASKIVSTNSSVRVWCSFININDEEIVSLFSFNPKSWGDRVSRYFQEPFVLTNATGYGSKILFVVENGENYLVSYNAEYTSTISERPVEVYMRTATEGYVVTETKTYFFDTAPTNNDFLRERSHDSKGVPMYYWNDEYTVTTYSNTNHIFVNGNDTHIKLKTPNQIMYFLNEKFFITQDGEILTFRGYSDFLLYVTKYYNTAIESASKVQTLLDLLKKCKITARFDNERWFASGNTTFHTLYNDPTYIPLSGYNDLGEDYEEITGLSIVNDNILAAYKRNRIYIITPITVGDELTYSYTETKNVIGNDAIGAPILTILTEMPTIVSYDGVYALNQLENVQSSDRITTLISEAINPLWLKESKDDIDNCKTLNRLYWTYYILPNKEKGISKIYLLDNRTQQWYYWELPVYVLDAYVKNNKTHLVTEDGLLYSLETSDLINEYNTDVTEYYDKINGKKHIIPWHWYSQILSLNTINYSKKLVDTTFILTDTDTQDEYALDYSFKAWRKSVSETNATTINNNIHYVKSTTKRTMIPRFNFIQFRLNNTEDDLDNNKLRLVGLGLKYVLLEGLY